MGKMNSQWLEENYDGGTSHPIRVVPDWTPSTVRKDNTRA